MSIMQFEYYVTPQQYEEAKLNGISYENVNNRIRSIGWNKQRAINEPLKTTRELKELSVIAKENGISYSTLKTRLGLGWSIERATTSPAIGRAENMRIQAEGRRINTAEDISRAKENGVSYGTFGRRMRDGWTLEDAIGVKTLSNSESGRRGNMEQERLREWNCIPQCHIERENFRRRCKIRNESV